MELLACFASKLLSKWDPAYQSGDADFVETNYLHTHLIAEFHNSWSGFLTLYSSRLIFHQCVELRRSGATLPASIWLWNLAWLFTSVGTIILHSTLSSLGQSLDELSMLVFVVLFSFNLRRMKSQLGHLNWNVSSEEWRSRVFENVDKGSGSSIPEDFSGSSGWAGFLRERVLYVYYSLALLTIFFCYVLLSHALFLVIFQSISFGTCAEGMYLALAFMDTENEDVTTARMVVSKELSDANTRKTGSGKENGESGDGNGKKKGNYAVLSGIAREAALSFVYIYRFFRIAWHRWCIYILREEFGLLWNSRISRVSPPSRSSHSSVSVSTTDTEGSPRVLPQIEGGSVVHSGLLSSRYFYYHFFVLGMAYFIMGATFWYLGELCLRGSTLAYFVGNLICTHAWWHFFTAIAVTAFAQFLIGHHCATAEFPPQFPGLKLEKPSVWSMGLRLYCVNPPKLE